MLASKASPPPEFDRLSRIAEPFLRRLYLVGLLTKYADSELAKPIVVGGNAVEFYTLGQYATGDVDLVCAQPRALERLLSAWGFERQGRHWRHYDLQLYVEIPGERLEGGDPARVVQGEVEGLSFRVIGPEDLILDRLKAAVHWGSKEDETWARELIFSQSDRLDWAYLADRAEEEEVSELLTRLRSDSEMKDATQDQV